MTERADWEIRQARTFEKWTNMYLAKKGYDAIPQGELTSCFDNGIKLMQLVNSLYDVPFPKRYKKAEKCKTRVMKQDNVSQALKMLAAAEVKTNFLKVANLLDADWKMILGMIWSIILDFNLKGLSGEDGNAKQGLLIWCRKKTKGYKGVDGNLNNFSKDWTNGNAFLALVDKHTTGVVDYNEMYDCSPEEKLDAAFSACENLGIARLLEVEDLTETMPDEKAVMTYVSELFKLFSKEDIKENAAEHIAKFLNFQRRIDALGADYERQFQEFEEWVNQKVAHFQNCTEPETNVDAKEALDLYKEFLIEEKPRKMADVVDIQDLYANIQAELKVNGRVSYNCQEGQEPERLNELVSTLQDAERAHIDMVRAARLGFIDKMEDGETVSDDKLKEFNETFDHFDKDNSGKLDKSEFQAAMSGVGIALNEEDFERVFDELKDEEEGHIARDTYITYLTNFFSTSDTADSVLKSLQVLGDPENITEEMLSQPPLSPEDVEYLLSKTENGNLAEVIQSVFA